jgi:Fe2+ or Zn2+ uptake regulation protein
MTADPAARLRAAGLRATRPRADTLAALDRLGGHRTADEIAAALQAGGRPIARATLYHVLASLATAGVVAVADAGPGASRFESSTGWHHHLVCSSCGAVVDVPCVGGGRPCLEPDLPGAEVMEARVTYRGRCPACVAAGASRSG